MLITYIAFFSLARYKLDLVEVEEVRWDKGAQQELGLYFFYGKERKIINWEQDFLYTTEYYQKLRE
jgi:hypothetical protein